MSNNFSEEENNLLQWLNQKGWVKQGQFIHCEKNNEINEIKISKFGGKIPHLQNEEIPKCPTCGKECELLLQLYVPGLPEYAQNLFPENLKDSLSLLFICAEDLPDMQGKMISRVYNSDQIDNLVYANPPENAQVESAIFTNYEMLDTYNDTSNEYMESMGEIDDAAMEELMRKIRVDIRKAKCYFGGYPYYQQSEETPGDDCTLLLNVEEDENCSLTWGDAGNAQIWVKNDNSGEFYLNWQCG